MAGIRHTSDRAGLEPETRRSVPAMEAAFALGLQQGRGYLNVHTNTFPGGEIRGVPYPGHPGTGHLGPAVARLRSRRRQPAPQAIQGQGHRPRLTVADQAARCMRSSRGKAASGFMPIG